MHHPSRGARWTRPLRDRRGIIVLGPLIVFVCLLVVMVVAGKLMYPAPRGIYRDTTHPQLHVAVLPASVHSGDRVVLLLQPGDSVWAVRLDNGSAVIFRDRTGRWPVGVTDGLLSAEARVRPG